MKTLFEIEGQLYALFAELEENGGEITPEIEELLLISKEELGQKLYAYKLVRGKKLAEAEFYHAEMQRLTARKKAAEAAADRIKAAMVDALNAFGDTDKNGKKRLEFLSEGITVSLSERKTPDSVVITDESALPESAFKIKKEISKTAISDMIKRGEEVAGAYIKSDNYTVIIK